MFKAKQIMNCSILSIGPDDTIDRAISLLIEHRISGLPVVDKAGCLVGVISEFDLLELICDCRDEKQTVSHYMSGDVCSVDGDADWVDVADQFRLTHMRRLPVTQNGKLVGIITRHDLIKTIQDLRRGVRKRTRNNARGSCVGSRKRQETINTTEEGASLTAESLLPSQAPPEHAADTDKSRRWTRFQPDLSEVWVTFSNAPRLARVVDESFGGIGLVMDKVDASDLQPGCEVTILHYGRLTRGSVKWITPQPETEQLRLGICWLPTKTSDG
jgi:CBS-domain-containing membrane protein